MFTFARVHAMPAGIQAFNSYGKEFAAGYGKTSLSGALQARLVLLR